MQSPTGQRPDVIEKKSLMREIDATLSDHPEVWHVFERYQAFTSSGSNARVESAVNTLRDTAVPAIEAHMHDNKLFGAVLEGYYQYWMARKEIEGKFGGPLSSRGIVLPDRYHDSRVEDLVLSLEMLTGRPYSVLRDLQTGPVARGTMKVFSHSMYTFGFLGAIGTFVTAGLLNGFFNIDIFNHPLYVLEDLALLDTAASAIMTAGAHRVIPFPELKDATYNADGFVMNEVRPLYDGTDQEAYIAARSSISRIRARKGNGNPYGPR